MDPVEKLWWYEGWIDEEETKLKNYRAVAILIGSFYNNELAQRMVKDDNPDYVSSDDEFEQSTQMIRDFNMQQEQAAEEQQQTGHRRRKRKVVR